MPQTAPQLTQQQVDDLKTKCKELKASFEAAGGGAFSSGPLDAHEIVSAIGDGTIWQLIIRYGPRVLAFILEILEQLEPQP